MTNRMYCITTLLWVVAVLIPCAAITAAAQRHTRDLGKQTKAPYVLVFAGGNMDFDPPVTRVNVDVDGPGSLTCFTRSGLDFHHANDTEGIWRLGVGTGTPRIVECVFSGGGSYSNVVTQ